MSMTLSEYIAEIGDAEAARRFGAKVRTVQSWRRRERYPRRTEVAGILAASDGRLSVEGIYGPFPIPNQEAA